MSRSYRKPYAAITGVYTGSADDKRTARRCWRRLQNRVLRETTDFDSFLNPHKYEASYNDVWGWGRDGNQQYYSLPVLDWDIYRYHKYHKYHNWTEEEIVQLHVESFDREVEWYKEITRK